MDIITLIFLALGLSMDATAVSVSNSMCYPDLSKKKTLLSCGLFGLFQGLMPVIGFYSGRLLGKTIMAIDHWIALILLCFIGGKMLFEGIRDMKKGLECDTSSPDFTFKSMLVQSIATSIDALAVGISLAALSVNIYGAALLIAVITFACSLTGSFLGKKFGALLGDWAEIAGGVILVGIGAKIFIEHMFMGG